MSSPGEEQPLLHEDRQAQAEARHDHVGNHMDWAVPARYQADVHSTRVQAQRFLTSKIGHYSVLVLVSLDVGCIFADFLINLYMCEHACRSDKGVSADLEKVEEILGVVSLVFSCLFVTELFASIWAFGFTFFNSWFHCFDAIVIIAGFVIDVCLKGVLEEVGSMVVVLRLWRVFKIIEEFSAGASEQMETMSEIIENLEVENKDLKRRLKDATGEEQ